MKKHEFFHGLSILQLNSILFYKKCIQISFWKLCYAYFLCAFSICPLCLLRTLSATKTFFLLRSTFLIVITDRIHFGGFLTNRAFISLVGLNMVVKCFLANANFVTNVTIHVFYTMNYPMVP